MLVRDHDLELLTVEEAAAASGRSVATVRRMCTSGAVRAVKRGRQWLIPADQVPAPTRSRRAIASTPDMDLTSALAHLRQIDFKEAWVPDVLSYSDYLAAADRIVGEATQRIADHGPHDRPLEIEMPKTPIFTRTAHQLSVVDHLAFQGVVASFSRRIDKLLSASVFSARLSPDPGVFTLDGRKQWLAWMESLSALIKSGTPWMLKTDLTAYFDTVSHKRLSEDLRTLNVPGDSIAAVERMLGEWSQHRGFGLPQGPNASRLLGNLYMAPVDHVLADGPWHYSRYMDDLRIVGKTRAEVLRGFRILERECKRRGLILSPAKTFLLHDAAALEDCEDEKLTAAQYWWDERRYSHARGLLKSIWDHSLTNDGNLNARHARFSLYRLGQIRDARPVFRVLRSLEFLGPVASTVALFLKPWLGRPRVAAAVDAYVMDPDRNTSPFTSAWLLAAVVDRLGKPTAGVVRYARSIVRERNEPVYHRGIALNVIAKSAEVVDIDLIRRTIADEFDPMILRAALVALARASHLDKSQTRTALRKSPALDITVHYLAGRSSLPSMLTRSQQVQIEQ